MNEQFDIVNLLKDKKALIGNAVEVNMSRVLCETLARKLMDKAA